MREDVAVFLCVDNDDFKDENDLDDKDLKGWLKIDGQAGIDCKDERGRTELEQRLTASQTQNLQIHKFANCQMYKILLQYSYVRLLPWYNIRIKVDTIEPVWFWPLWFFGFLHFSNVPNQNSLKTQTLQTKAGG